MENRIKYIDIARGISIICIVLGHIGISEINKIVFTFHVPIFYFITGYFFSTSASKQDFVLKKFRTLIFPYGFTCLVITLLSIIFSLLEQDGEEPMRVAVMWLYASLYGAGDHYSDPFLILPIGAIWFLWASFWGSVFLRCILDLKEKFRIIAVALLFAAGYLTRAICWFPLSIQAGCCAVIFMYMGYLLRSALPHLKAVPKETKTAFSVFALAVWLCFIKNFTSFWLVHNDVGNGAMDIAGSICGSYIVILISQYIEKHSKILTNALSFLGKNSIFVLCSHIMELNLISWSSFNDYLNGMGISRPTIILISIFLKFLWIITVTIICSKSNIMRRIFGMGPKPAVTAVAVDK